MSTKDFNGETQLINKKMPNPQERKQLQKWAVQMIQEQNRDPQVISILQEMIDYGRYEVLRPQYIKDRKLVGNHLGSYDEMFEQSDYENFATMVRHCPQITEFSLGKMEIIENTGFPILVEALSNNLNMTTLKFSRVTGNFMNGVAKIIRINPSIETLIFEDCDLRVDQVKILAKHLRSNTYLKNLTIDGLEENGALWIAKALLENNTLQKLIIRHGKIGSNGEFYKEMLIQNDTLQYLDLSYNDMDNVSAEALIEGLHANNSLETLYIGSNKISKDWIALLKKVVQKKNGFELLGAENQK